MNGARWEGTEKWLRISESGVHFDSFRNMANEQDVMCISYHINDPTTS